MNAADDTTGNFLLVFFVSSLGRHVLRDQDTTSVPDIAGRILRSENFSGAAQRLAGLLLLFV
jgi:hypothetical protein